jgi:phosphatidylcholine synthase
LTFVPIKVVHPFRVRALRALTASLAVVWMFLTAWVLVHYPTLSPPLIVFWVALAVYFIGISAWRTLTGAKDQGVET